MMLSTQGMVLGSRYRRGGCGPQPLRRPGCRQFRLRRPCCHRQTAQRKNPARRVRLCQRQPAYRPVGSTQLRCGCRPTRPHYTVVAEPPYDSGAAVGGHRYGVALFGFPNRAAANQLAALLAPGTSAAAVDPAAPVFALSPSPPTISVLPSADIATELPVQLFRPRRCQSVCCPVASSAVAAGKDPRRPGV